MSQDPEGSLRLAVVERSDTTGSGRLLNTPSRRDGRDHEVGYPCLSINRSH